MIQKKLIQPEAAIKPVLAIPAVGAIIKPTVDAIRAKLDTLATT